MINSLITHLNVKYKPKENFEWVKMTAENRKRGVNIHGN
jgi:hypothetical protein